MGIQITGSNDTIQAADGNLSIEGVSLNFNHENVTGISTMATAHVTGTTTIDNDLKVGVSTFFWFEDKILAILISCALVINLISSVIAGILVPLVLRKINQDPAIGGSVVVTTVTDVIGFISFLGLATIYLI